MTFPLLSRQAIPLIALSSILALSGCASAGETGKKPATANKTAAKTKKAVKPVQGDESVSYTHLTLPTKA